MRLRAHAHALSQVLGESLVRCVRESTEAGTPFRLRTFIGGRSRFENAGAIAMARAFAAIGTLERVSMPQNGIYHEGISALADAFVKCPNMKHLDLADNTLTVRGASALAKVRVRPHTHALFLHRHCHICRHLKRSTWPTVLFVRLVCVNWYQR